jgi:hydroxyacid-oxoacid transhydrogenase
MSYPVSSSVRGYTPDGYSGINGPMIPHGQSVIMHAPAVFRFTSKSNPQRHLRALQQMGVETRSIGEESAGHHLAEKIVEMMRLMRVPNGLSAVGFTRSDIPQLVQATLPQQRVLQLSPRPVGEQELTKLFEESLQIY